MEAGPVSRFGQSNRPYLVAGFPPGIIPSIILYLVWRFGTCWVVDRPAPGGGGAIILTASSSVCLGSFLSFPVTPEPRPMVL
jgi:hypothetical protein